MAIRTLEERQKQQRALADKQLAAAADTRKKDDAAALKTAYGEVDAQVKETTDGYREKQEEATDEARTLYEKHALEEELDRQAVDLRMANLGLQNSGLAAVSEQAAATHRAYKDKHNQKQLSDYVEELTQAIKDVVQQGKDKKAALKQDSDADFNNWYASLAQKTYANADKTAKALYNADVKAEKEAKKAAEESNKKTNKKEPSTPKDTTTQQAPETPEETPAKPVVETFAQENVDHALATVHTWDAANGGIFNKTFWMGPKGDGENVYEDIVEEQLLQSRAYRELGQTEKNCAIAMALGKSVALTWPDREDTTDNAARLTAALAVAQRQHGWDHDTYKHMETLARSTLAEVQLGLKR